MKTLPLSSRVLQHLISDAPWNPAILDVEFDADEFDEPAILQERRDARDHRESTLTGSTSLPVLLRFMLQFRCLFLLR